MTINIACDHAGFEYKLFLSEKLKMAGHELTDFGTDSYDSVDYPDFVWPAVNDLSSNKKDFGVLICGSGNGVSMTANKHPKVRAALCWNKEIASLARQHNNANVICIPARMVSKELAWDMIETFLTTAFEAGRHTRRVSKISSEN